MISSPLDFLLNCSTSFLNDDHYDVSNRLKPTVKFTNVDHRNIIRKFDEIAAEIYALCDNVNISNSQLAMLSEEKIYKACKSNKKETLLVTSSTNNIPKHQNSDH